MSAQREKPEGQDLLAAIRGMGLVSGTQIENFREGWAIFIMYGPGKMAHWFKRDDFGFATTLCKRTAPVRWLYGRGNYPCCKRCVRLRDRMNSAARVG